MNPFGQSILAEELSEIVNAPIHLVDLAEIDTELMADIFSKGRLIHCPDEERYKEERAKV